METFSWNSLSSSAFMFIFTIICLSYMIHTSEAQATTDPDEVRALKTIVAKWEISDTWNMSSDPCDDNDSHRIGWSSYIKCDCSYNNGTLCHITGMKLYDIRINGEFPEELQNLSQLNDLNFTGNSLTGPLPSFIGNLTKLRKLDLSSNSLTGTIPKELGNLQDLFSLGLSFNSLSGTIPKELGNLKNLKGLYMSFNSLTGQIPKELGNLENLVDLDLNSNSLSRTIPKEFGNLKNLQNLFLSYNSLSGPIPKELWNLQNLQDLDLSSNLLSGPIANEIGNLRNLGDLDLNTNSLSGTIPKELGNLRKLKGLYLGYNSLSEQIPKELGNLQNLQYLSLGNNSLSGTIPKELGNLLNITDLDLSINSFTGSLPSSLGNLTNMLDLYINSAGLSGEIPSTFANLQKMKNLRAFDNNFSGKLPDFIGTWTNMKTLSLHGNAFQGSIPSNFSRLTSLKRLQIGELSSARSSLEFIVNMKSLKILILRNCMIRDSLPSYIGNFTELEYLDLSFNNIFGSIPQSLFNMSSLKYLFLGNNDLAGALPSNKSSNLIVIDLSYNSFSGRLPSWTMNNNIDLQLNLVANNFTKDNLKSNPEYAGLHCIQRDFPCNRGSPKYSSFAVNSGGPAVHFSENVEFENDDKDLGAASFYVPNNQRWAVSSVGLYPDRKNSDYIIKSSSEKCYIIDSAISITNQSLLKNVRISAGSLRYYGLGLINGSYTVILQFEELNSANESTQQSLHYQVFDIYIQGKLRQKDFDISNETVGSSKDLIKEYKGTQVNESFLEIHLFWAGKGIGDLYGPSISAISAILEPIPYRRNLGIFIGIPVSCGLIILIAILIAFILRRNMSLSNDEELRGITFRTHTFSYSELKKATDGFDPRNKLGEGGFGPVYKGVLSDGRRVAVKQLSLRSHQGKIQFVTEIDMISTVQHRNLVKLYGCCIEGTNRLLVYEYLENKSVDQALFGKNDLDLSWKTRFEICVGMGRGLAYLHEECRPKIVHRDIKASNILLDAELKPKLSDFGLAKLYDDSITHISTKVAGTVGYLAPEYAMKGHLSEKADVFGFGVALLEILSGRPNFASNLSPEKVYLLEWAWLLYETGRPLELIDSKLKDFNKEEANRVFTVGLLCTQLSPTLRPSMSRVVSMLLGEVELNVISSKPGYFNDLKTVGLESPPSILTLETSMTLSIQSLETR